MCYDNRKWYIACTKFVWSYAFLSKHRIQSRFFHEYLKRKCEREIEGNKIENDAQMILEGLKIGQMKMLIYAIDENIANTRNFPFSNYTQVINFVP